MPYFSTINLNSTMVPSLLAANGCSEKPWYQIVLKYGCMKPIEKSLRRGFDSRQLHHKHTVSHLILVDDLECAFDGADLAFD
jgi:hypothetical protein